MDKARKQTDKILSDMEKEVSRIYRRASDEISEKWKKYMKSHEKKVKSAYDDLQKAISSGDRDTIKEAREVYERTVKNVTLNSNRYKAMLDETTTKLANTNEVALDYINGNMAKVYTINYNAFGDVPVKGYSFSLVNEQAVKELATTDKMLLPVKRLDIPKDKRWNTKSINSEVLQGILQGESIPKIASRLTHVTDMNRNSSIRNARTMVTSAENKGRQDSFIKASEDGVRMKRKWVATHDERTRAWHADLDGVETDLDEPWENEYGLIMYPGDPSADPANVYNCRCSVRAHVLGFTWNTDGEMQEEAVPEESKALFEEVRTKDDAYESLLQTFTDVDEDVLKLDEELLVNNVNRFNELNARFGAVNVDDGSYFSVNNSKKYVAEASSGYRANGQVELSLSNSFYKKIDVYHENYDKAQQSGFNMPSADEYKDVYVITHEYGHILEGAISRARTDFDEFEKYNLTQRVKEYVKSEEKLADTIREEIVGIAQSNNPNFNLDDNLSRLGHSNSFEFFAEVFANSQCGNPTELGLAMQEWLEKEGF